MTSLDVEHLAEHLEDALYAIRTAICKPGVPCDCPSGGVGTVGDLTEAAISISSSIRRHADAVSDLGAAVDRIGDILESRNA